MAFSKVKNTERAAEGRAFHGLSRRADGKGVLAEAGRNQVALSLLPAGNVTVPVTALHGRGW